MYSHVVYVRGLFGAYIYTSCLYAAADFRRCRMIQVHNLSTISCMLPEVLVPRLRQTILRYAFLDEWVPDTLLGLGNKCSH